MPAPLSREVVAGSIAGFAGGLVFWLTTLGMETTSVATGLLGLKLSGAWVLLHLLVATLAGGGLGAISTYQPLGYAAGISIGLLYGLFWWTAGPLTLEPLFYGDGPAWTIEEARMAFPSLFGHLLYGGLAGFGLYIGVFVYNRVRPESPVTEGESVAPTRVVILGGGFGGVNTAQALEKIFWRDSSLEISLVSQSNYLLFTPMLAEVAGSALEPQHMCAPVRASLPRTRFYRSEVEEIDTDAKTVRIRGAPSVPAHTLPYDQLVLALGSVPNYFGLPGMEEYAFSLKTLKDATDLRNHVISQLEHADVNPDEEERRHQLTFVVAGGGFAGTELIAELFDLVHSVMRFYPNIRSEEMRFVLVHSRDRILPELGEELADYALRKLQMRGVEFVLNARVAGATPDSVYMNDGQEIPARTIVWTAGNQPNPALKTLPCERNRAGALLTESTLLVKGFENVWALGDCAVIPDPDREGQTYPPTAQHAIREGKALAKNIEATLRGKPLKPFRFRTIGLLVPLGHRTGAAEIRGLRFSGLLAWLMWRVIYLNLLPGFEKKMRVFLDWSIDLFFARDIVLTAESKAPTLTQMVGTPQEPGISPAQPTPSREERSS